MFPRWWICKVKRLAHSEKTVCIKTWKGMQVASERLSLKRTYPKNFFQFIQITIYFQTHLTSLFFFCIVNCCLTFLCYQCILQTLPGIPQQPVTNQFLKWNNFPKHQTTSTDNPWLSNSRKQGTSITENRIHMSTR